MYKGLLMKNSDGFPPALRPRPPTTPQTKTSHLAAKPSHPRPEDNYLKPIHSMKPISASHLSSQRTICGVRASGELPQINPKDNFFEFLFRLTSGFAGNPMRKAVKSCFLLFWLIQSQFFVSRATFSFPFSLARCSLALEWARKENLLPNELGPAKLASGKRKPLESAI